MSKTIDERVVEMRFDNANFEKNIHQSQESLEKFNKSLGMDGAAKGLEKVNEAAKNSKIPVLGDAVESVKVKFSALEVMAMTALANITNSVVDAGKRLVDSFTIAPLRDGFNEYELKMGAVQTIMASSGEKIEVVNKYLEELNEYADKTIYSFSDMTQSIGKFTNAGVSLDDAVKAIKGISNEAAVSGANANEASRAMYNFAQALSAGHVKLIDWKSIENANMATVEFKQALMDTAVEMKTLVKEGDEYQSLTTDAKGKVSDLFTATSNFNDSLSHQWMTTEVLTKTLAKYANEEDELGKKAYAAAQDVKTFSQLMDTLKEAAGSGWAQSFEIIFGDLEHAKELWTGVSQVVGGFIDQSAKARNAFLQEFKDLGGIQAIFDTIKNIFAGIGSVINPIRQAFHDIFPKSAAGTLAAITKGLADFTSHLKLSGAASDALRSIFRGLFAAIDIVITAIKTVISILMTGTHILDPIVSFIGFLVTGILSAVGAIGEWIVALDNAIKESEYFSIAIKAIKNAIQWVVDQVGPFFEKLKGYITSAVDSIKEFAKLHFGKPDTSELGEFSDDVQKKLNPIDKVINGIKTAFEWLIGFLKKVGSAIAAAGKWIVDGVKKIWNALGGINTTDVAKLLGGGAIVAILAKLNGFIKSIKGVTDSATSFIKGLRNITDAVVDTFKAVQNNIKSKILMRIAVAIGILAAALYALANLDPTKLGVALGAITGLFVDLFGSMTLFQKVMDEKGLSTTKKLATSMIALALAVDILASAVKKLSELDWNQLAKGLTGVTILLGEMTAAMILLSKKMGPADAQGGGSFQISVLGILAFAGAMVILSTAVKMLGELDFGTLIKGLLAVSVLLGELYLFLKGTSKFSGMSVATGLALIELSAAILILGKSVKNFASMDTDALLQGLLGVGAVLAEVATFSLGMSEAEHVMASAVALTILGAAMLVFYKAVEKIGNLPLGTIVQGLAGMGVVLLEVTLALRKMPADMMAIGLGLMEVSLAMVVMSGAIALMGSMKFETLAKGLLAMAGSLTIMTKSLNKLGKEAAKGGVVKAASALLILSAALLVLTPSLMLLGTMSLPAIGAAVLALAGAFTVLGVAGTVLSPVAGTILVLSGAVALLGVGLLAAGAGVLAFSVGLAGLAAAGTAAAYALVKMIDIVLTGVVTTLTHLTSAIGELIKAGYLAFLGIIIDCGPVLAEAIKTVVLSIVDVVVTCAPEIAEGILAVVDSVLDSMVAHGPSIVSKVMDFLIGVIHALAEKLPALIKEAVNLLGAFFQGIADAIGEISPDRLLKWVEGIGIITILMYALSSAASIAGSAMVGVLAVGAVIAELALVLAAIGGLAQIPGLKWLIDEGGELLASVGAAVGKFIGGFVGGIMEGISSQLPQMGKNLSDFMTNVQGFIDGAAKIDKGTMEGVQALAETILILTAADILEGLTSWLTGGTSMAEFGKELCEFGPYMKRYAASVKGLDAEVVTASAVAANALAELASNLPNSGGWLGTIVGNNDIDEWGEKLPVFGRSLKKYSISVKGLNAAVVVESANAAKALAELAANLPNSGGWLGAIVGNNDIDEWGEKLPTFGKSLKKYSISVKGLNAGVVVESANAAKALSELAANLPNSGGWLGAIVGNNDIDDWGVKLPIFGKSLKDYADSVDGLNPDVVTNSANAAKALSELADNLPNSGGVMTWFVGDNDISVFGESLSKFGRSFAAYYESIAGIQTDQLDAVIVELEKLINIAKGSADIDTSGMYRFSEMLQSLGGDAVDAFISAFTNATEKVQSAVDGMMGSVVSAITSQTDRIKKESSNAGQSVSTGLVGGMNFKAPLVKSTATKICNDLTNAVKNALPAKTFNAIAQNQVMQSLINGLNTKKPLLLTTIKNICDNFVSTTKLALPAVTFNVIIAQNQVMQGLINGLLTKKPLLLQTMTDICNALVKIARDILSIETFQKIGTDIIQGIINGLSNSAKLSELTAAIKSLCEKIKSEFESAIGNIDFGSIGSTIVGKILEGIKNYNKDDMNKVASELCNAIHDAIATNMKEDDFYNIGANAGKALAKGLKDKKKEVTDAAKDMVSGAASAVKNALKINSPSKVFYDIGKYMDMGLINGIVAYTDQVGNVSEDLGNEASNSLQAAMKKLNGLMIGELDMNPTICPVMDLTEIQNGAGKMNRLLTRGLNLSASYDRSLNASENLRNTTDGSFAVSGTVQNNYNFTQNNYSPKALSRIDIYRQTQNQFAAMKGAVGGI